MKDEELYELSKTTREKFLEKLKECEEDSPLYKILDSAIWGLEDLEQYLQEK